MTSAIKFIAAIATIAATAGPISNCGSVAGPPDPPPNITAPVAPASK